LARWRRVYPNPYLFEKIGGGGFGTSSEKVYIEGLESKKKKWGGIGGEVKGPGDNINLIPQQTQTCKSSLFLRIDHEVKSLQR